LANFYEHFGNELLGARRYNRKVTEEPTEKMELVFDFVNISFTSAKLRNPRTDLKRAPRFVVDSVLHHTLPKTILLVMRN
jgi:hypothetical protein